MNNKRADDAVNETYRALKELLKYNSYAFLLEKLAEIAEDDVNNLEKHCNNVAEVIYNASCDVRTALHD